MNGAVLMRVLMTVAVCWAAAGDAWAGAAHVAYATARGEIAMSTWKSRRDKSIEKQDLDYSCGSAAAATIQRYFYGQAVDEQGILDQVVAVGDDGAASFSDLKHAVAHYGFKAIGLTLSFERLKGIRIPAIVYLRYRDKDHFSVIRGIDARGRVWLGDPSWGNRLFSQSQFKAMWETRDSATLTGKILLITPQASSAASVNHAFFQPPRANATAVRLLTLRR